METHCGQICGLLQGENCMMRMQFAGSSTAEALNQCSRAVEKLMEYVPVTAVEVSATHPNQPPTEDPPAAQVTNLTCQ